MCRSCGEPLRSHPVFDSFPFCKRVKCMKRRGLEPEIEKTSGRERCGCGDSYCGTCAAGEVDEM